jgi:twinkle protein
MVIGLERDAQNDDPDVRNTTRIRVLKNRFSGITGPCCDLKYDIDTGRLNEVKSDDF